MNGEKMKARAPILILLVITCSLVYSGFALFGNDLESFAGEEGRVRIAGGTAHIPFMKEAARRIMKFNPDIRISVAGGGSGAGIKQVGEGLVDIGNSGRKATDAEIRKYGLETWELAIDGIAVIVNPENPVRALSSLQLRKIYSGVITDWSDVGGEKGPITVYTRDNSSGTRAVFRDTALERETITPRAHFTVSNGAMKAAVSQDPGGIGYISAGFIDRSVVPVTLDGILPTEENIRLGRYGISRILYCYTRGEPQGLTRKLIKFLLSPEGQEIVQEQGFIPVK